ncbi:MAG: hypothetical protein R3B47_08985 [Bacteroidia bacterium]
MDKNPGGSLASGLYDRLGLWRWKKDLGTFLTSNRHAYSKGAHYTVRARIKHFFGKELMLLQADVKLWPTPEPAIVVTSASSMAPGEIVARTGYTFTADLSKATVPPGYYFEFEWVFSHLDGTSTTIPYSQHNQSVQYSYANVGEQNRVWLHIRTRNAAGTLTSCGQIYGGSKCFFNAYIDVTTKAYKQAYYLPYYTWQVDPARFLVHGGTIRHKNASPYEVGVSTQAFTPTVKKSLSLSDFTGMIPRWIL